MSRTASMRISCARWRSSSTSGELAPGVEPVSAQPRGRELDRALDAGVGELRARDLAEVLLRLRQLGSASGAHAAASRSPRASAVARWTTGGPSDALRARPRRCIRQPGIGGDERLGADRVGARRACRRPSRPRPRADAPRTCRRTRSRDPGAAASRPPRRSARAGGAAAPRISSSRSMWHESW